MSYVSNPKPMGDAGAGGGGGGWRLYSQETSMKIVKALFYVH